MLHDLVMSASIGKEGPDTTKLCGVGEETLALTLSDQQRAALPDFMCEACLNTFGGAELFPQCAPKRLRAVPVTASVRQQSRLAAAVGAAQPTELGTSEQALIAVLSAAAFATGALLARHRSQ